MSKNEGLILKYMAITEHLRIFRDCITSMNNSKFQQQCIFTSCRCQLHPQILQYAEAAEQSETETIIY